MDAMLLHLDVNGGVLHRLLLPIIIVCYRAYYEIGQVFLGSYDCIYNCLRNHILSLEVGHSVKSQFVMV